MLPLRLFLVLALMFPAALVLADENRDTVVASTDRFEFHSNPRVALHHFLIAWAAADHFHEASHVGSLEAPLTTLVEEAFRAAGGEAPERFWHDMIFFTTGTITRIVLDELGQHDYRHYGESGVYQRGERWAEQLPLLEQYWQPFLESGSTDADERRAALDSVAERLLAE